MKFTQDMTVNDVPKNFRGAFSKWKKYHNTPIDEIFWKKVDVKSKDECWEFKGGKHKTGYGLFYLRGDKFDQMLAHRMAWIISFGHIPEGHYVCHKCDNPPCCNPSHLFTGTQKENVDDMWNKGRGNPLRGQSHPHAKLSESQVIEIRRRYHPKKTTYRLLAEEFGMSKSAIQHIVNGRIWKYLPNQNSKY